MVARRRIDVVLPTHEQAWLLAAARALLSADVRIALAPAEAFGRVQSKVAFAQLLDELGLPQPSWQLACGPEDLADVAFPYWLKAPFSTAGQGVREVVDARSRAAALDALLDRAPLLAQRPAPGRYGQAQGLFDRGRLVAVHTSVLRAVGVGGSAAARLGVDHSAPREHMAALGEALDWHGGLTLDYMHEHGAPLYIECNPRTVEPGNATASGVNIPELQVRLTLGEQLGGPARVGIPGVRTHGAIALLLGAAARGESRGSLARGVLDAVAHRGVCDGSAEQLTPVRRDPPSVLAAAFVAGRVLLSPPAAAEIARHAVSAYAIDPAGVGIVERAAAERARA